MTNQEVDKRFDERFGVVEYRPIHAKSAIRFFIHEELHRQAQEIIDSIQSAYDDYDMTEEMNASEPIMRKLQELKSKYL